MGANNYQIIWFDCRFDKSTPSIKDELNIEAHKIFFFDHYQSHTEVINFIAPKLVCFDFDIPDKKRLAILEKIRLEHPKIPIIMITADYSTELVIWALRIRVWNYFIKPVALSEINHSIDTLIKLVNVKVNHQSLRKVIHPETKIPDLGRDQRQQGMKTFFSIHFTKQNLEKKISVTDIAKKCGMSRSHFSRTFKKEHNITFQEFLMQQRIEEAVKLLTYSDLHITQIAQAVGYNLLSNFTTSFQKAIGISPSNFRKNLK